MTFELLFGLLLLLLLFQFFSINFLHGLLTYLGEIHLAVKKVVDMIYRSLEASAQRAYPVAVLVCSHV